MLTTNELVGTMLIGTMLVGTMLESFARKLRCRRAKERKESCANINESLAEANRSAERADFNFPRRPDFRSDQLRSSVARLSNYRSA